jgi:hypothetical protein
VNMEPIQGKALAALIDFKRRLDERDAILSQAPKPTAQPVLVREQRMPVRLFSTSSQGPRPKQDEGFPAALSTSAACCFYYYNVGIGGPMPGFPDAWLPGTVLLGMSAIVLTYQPGGNYTFQSADGTQQVVADNIDTGSWVYGDPDGLWDSSCLYGKYEPLEGQPNPIYIFDAYSTTYTLTGGGIGTVTLTRTVATDPTTLTQGSCIWTDGGDNVLQYNSSGPNQYLFTLSVSGTTYVLAGNQTAPNANGANNYSPYTVS